jgi:hypothetical protein
MSLEVEDLDLYDETRKYPLAYDSTVDPVVVQEMELMAAEAKRETGKKASGDSDVGSDVETASEGSTSEDSSDSEYEEADEGDDEWEDVSDVPKAVKGAKKKKAKASKVFTPVDKVYSVCVVMSTLIYCPLQIHCVAVHILRSEIRRKTARRLIRRKVNKKYRHLVFIRSMKVRWNTTLAELERAQLLQPVRIFLSFSRHSLLWGTGIRCVRE